MKLEIACLPVAGIENPYQYLMIEGLNKSKSLNAYNGIEDRFFGIIRTSMTFSPDYIHFDWINSYYERRSFWMTLVCMPLFLFQIYYIRLFTKTKIVWTLHNILPHDTKRIWFHKIVRSWFSKQCKWIRVFSEESIIKANKTLNIPIKKFEILPEGDYKSFYPNLVNKKEARSYFDIPVSSKVLLFLGLLKPYKGIEKLIDAFHEIKDDSLILIIAGAPINSDYSSSLSKKLSNLSGEDKVIFHNKFIRKEDLQYYFNASDIVVLPFDKVENSGSAILAMGFRKAIVAPKMGVLKTRLKNQESLLFTDLKKTLKVAVKFNKKKLCKIGEENFENLNQHKWENFSSCFTIK